ncbi:hypothetical protein J2Z22_001137 [Paenibacillus forsythiae]|uniref:Uncharacterized protein n=1 Tax=Paenibacillus forsythiae TaxID=365616 RepID=A0ABU3H471_9BACL|nr:hypothetical protein [Paenibacillus forsythiae]
MAVRKDPDEWPRDGIRDYRGLGGHYFGLTESCTYI